MRKLASIQVVKDLRPIVGADKIETAQIEGWELVVKKDEFKIGDKVVYFEIDSILPDKPEFEFMKDRKFRVKTIKLRGQISQGLVMPMEILPKKYINAEVGTDVTDIIGVKKYDPDEFNTIDTVSERNYNRLCGMHKNWVKHLLPKRFVKWLYMHYPKYAKRIFVDKTKDDKTVWPQWISKTDETRVQTLEDYFVEKYKDTEFSYTEKVDGSSATFYLKDGHFGVCSRNYELKDMFNNKIYWDIARKFDIEQKLKNASKGEPIFIQGEIIGPSIQGNPYKLTETDFFVFNVKDDDGYKTQAEVTQWCADYGFKPVPYLGKGIKILAKSVQEILEMADAKSVVNKDVDREGIVFRAMDNGRVSFKAVSNKYLLKHGG